MIRPNPWLFIEAKEARMVCQAADKLSAMIASDLPATRRKSSCVCAELESGSPFSRVVYNGANLMEGDEAAGLVEETIADFGRRRHPRQQCRHPARQPDRELSRREI